MVVRTPRYSADEAVRRGQEIYERTIRAQLLPAHIDLFLAIDIETEDFELAADDVTVSDRLRTRRPDAEIFLMRVGHPGAYRMGRPVGSGGLG